jgi:GT2 family glycosyltransferase
MGTRLKILHNIQNRLVVDADESFSFDSAGKERTPLSITIGIPSYFAERNIKNLIEALIRQSEDAFKIKKIIVYYDASGDDTLAKAREVNDQRIEIIDGKIRKGFAYGVKTLLAMNETDILLLLNDDIKIVDENLIQKLVQPFIVEENVGLVSGNPQPLKPKTFIDKAVASRRKTGENLNYLVNHGSNAFWCDGKTLALSKAFIQKLNLPEDNTELGNVDTYLYFASVTSGLKHRSVRDAIVYYRNPTTWNDYVEWYSRNRIQKYILHQQFGKALVDKACAKPKLLRFCIFFLQFMKNPLGCLFVVLTEPFLILKSRSPFKILSATWDVVKTTKDLT